MRRSLITAELLSPVEVSWIDSASHGGWKSAAAEAQIGSAQCKSAGYLLAVDKTDITVVQSVALDGGVADAISIPLVAVVAVRELS